MSYRTSEFLRGIAAFAAGCAILSGCAGHHLITGDLPRPAAPREEGNNETLLFERAYRYAPNGAVTFRTHTIMRVGAHGTEEALTVYDGSVTRLTAYEARVARAGGSVEWYEKGDLANYALSNADVIAEESIKFVPLREVPRAGDVIETVAEHEMALPQLGINFSADETDRDADTVRCTVTLPPADTLRWVARNGLGAPAVARTGAATEYRFTCPHVPPGKRSAYAKRNDAPCLLAVDPAVAPGSWAAFGDWYSALIEPRLAPDQDITDAARRHTRPDMTDLEKMNAIVQYCQSVVRYEQVYLRLGEFIPNQAATVLRRRYGDCKDYTCLILSMARVLGLDAQPALSHRGSRYEMCDALPVAQFNHMLVHFRSGGRDYWYDGTNQSGLPGIVADDLVNAEALVVDRGRSRMMTIPESPGNLCDVSGDLRPHGSALVGALTVGLSSQYAIRFLYTARLWNEGTMRSSLEEWLRSEL
ncbi:MAG TPA: transglutaminase domain-containing protein, partial [Bacteroidota bacterium]|nr:transglutaminase domain-containing protein [Bacteroidota bacterium]